MEFNYCMKCAAPLTKKNNTDYVCANGHPYWNNPKGTASVVFVKDHEILVSKRAIDPHKDKFDIPGGFINYGENPYDAARREMHEETSVEPLDLELFHVAENFYGVPGITTTDIYFICRKWSGEFRPSDDVAELSWQPVEFLDRHELQAWVIPGLAEAVRTAVAK